MVKVEGCKDGPIEASRPSASAGQRTVQFAARDRAGQPLAIGWRVLQLQLFNVQLHRYG
jgi:hypothetical protein